MPVFLSLQYFKILRTLTFMTFLAYFRIIGQIFHFRAQAAGVSR
jgi:hypothetical protein